MYMAGLLYLGAAAGMAAVRSIGKCVKEQRQEARLTKGDAGWIGLIILLDILAPYLLMSGLKNTSAANASLLTNFELAATAMMALLFFREAVGKRMWLAIGIISVASLLLCIDFQVPSSFVFSSGSVMILGACLCWGVENNCTRNLSAKDPAQIVVIKGLGSGFGALLIALFTERLPNIQAPQILAALALGFVSFGLSIFFYVRAQRHLGAARTGVYYAAAPFLGVMISFLLLGERPGLPFALGALLMVMGVALAMYEKHCHAHRHVLVEHEHAHCHDDGHHGHIHNDSDCTAGEHCHPHLHEPVEHDHEHRPDIHHRHMHND